jgi:hypothetical protein
MVIVVISATCEGSEDEPATLLLPLVSTPKPPDNTDIRDLLMPLHIISERIVPLLATKAPVITSRELSILNPVALVAIPDIALRKLMTIGMSLPPTGSTNMVPRARLTSASPTRAATLSEGFAVMR